MRKILFLGNGINRLTEGFSWKNLIEKLYKDTGINNRLDNSVPLPFVYEYIYQIGYKMNKDKENFEGYLLKQIIEMIGSIKANSFHNMLRDTNYTDIITTNYDYNQEDGFFSKITGDYYSIKIGDPNEREDGSVKKSGKKRETIYRRYTCSSKEERKVWHIHGELLYPKTIVLGYEFYLKTTTKIEEHLNNKVEKESWIDLFLNYDVDIIGYDLNYNESTIWYILNYRAREITEGRFKNRITYHILKKDFNDHLIKILNSFYVEAVCHDFDSYNLMYKKVFQDNSF